MGQGMVDNMATISHVTNEMHQMVTQGKMTQEQQRQMMDMMNQMGTMMQQMAYPKGRSMEKEHTNKLHEMEKRLQTMKDQMAKQ
jgi:polyhydroxyalkanoate synthesis regulator phasin